MSSTKQLLRKMKVSLVFHRMKYKTGDPPLGMALLAGNLRKNGFGVEIIDTTFHQSLDYVKERLTSFNPDWVAIYSDTMMYNDCIKISEMAKEMGKKVILGGPHPTLKPETLIDHGDYLVQGEAEVTIIDVINGKFNGTKIVKGVPADIETLPMATYDLLEMKEYIKRWHLLDSINPDLHGTSMFSARGCSFRCTFCQPVLDKLFGRLFRTRSVDSIIQELKYLKENVGIKAFFFQDDTFTLKKIWIREFCKRVIDEIYHKDIKLEGIPEKIALAEKIGIHCLCFFMLGAPGETREEIEKTIKFAASLDATEITATKI